MTAMFEDMMKGLDEVESFLLGRRPDSKSGTRSG